MKIIDASFSFYAGDCQDLIRFINQAREYARDKKQPFMGISVDVDEDGFVHIYAAGMEPITL